jgi:hypothetical protein
MLREASVAQRNGGAVVVLHRHDFARYCRDLAAANGIDLTGVRFMSHADIVRGEWQGRPAHYFVDQGPPTPLGFWAEWDKLRNWLKGRQPSQPKPGDEGEWRHDQPASPTCEVYASRDLRCGKPAEWFHPTGCFWLCRECFWEYDPAFRLGCSHITTTGKTP